MFIVTSAYGRSSLHYKERNQAAQRMPRQARTSALPRSLGIKKRSAGHERLAPNGVKRQTMFCRQNKLRKSSLEISGVER